MTRRLIGFVVLTAIMVAGAVWLADRPGEVTIRWQGWRVDTTVPVLGIALVLAWAVLALVMRIVSGVLFGPGRLLARWRMARRHKGYVVLTQGMSALAAGDAAGARRLARRADRLLQAPEATGLLAAQAARLGARGPETEQVLSHLADNPKTRILGLQGLMDLALDAGDQTKALDLAMQAWNDGAKGPDLLRVAVRLSAQAGLWVQAETLLDQADRRGVLTGADLLEWQAVILLERSRSPGISDRMAALLADQAHKCDPYWVPAAVGAALAWSKLGKTKKAQTIIESTFAAQPHPDLADAYLSLVANETVLARVKRVERLVNGNPDSAVAHLALAQAALSARLWGQARTHAERAVDVRPSRRGFELLARIHKDEATHGHGGHQALGRDSAGAQLVQTWLDRAATAPADPHWACGECGHVSPHWSALCPSCRSVNRLDWHQ